MTDPDNSDARLDRLLRGAAISGATPAPPDDLADRIVGFATLQPQRKPFTIGALVRHVLDGVMADWPHGLAYKAAVMLLVAVVTFGSGIERGFRGASQQADAELVNVIFGDFTGNL